MKLYHALSWTVIVVTALYSFCAWKRVTSWLGPRSYTWVRGVFLAVLVMCSCFAVGNYTRWGKWRNGNYVNAWEFYHYYMGSKYSPELGYMNLYGATLAADSETGLKFGNQAKAGKKNIRNLRTGAYISIARALEAKQKYKELFTEARWKEFVDDVGEFKRRLVQRRWNLILRDKGYNATPVWTFLVRTLLSNRIPASSQGGMLFLALLDPLLIALAMACVWWAFGSRAVMLAITLLGTHYMMHFSHMQGAFLRTDWAMCAVMAVCMLKKEHYKTAGCLLAYSTLSRMFPAVLFFGIGAKFFWDMVMNRRIARNYIGFFGAATVTVVVLVACSLVQPKGPELWTDFRTKIAKHATDVSPWRVGFKQLYAMQFSKVSDKEKLDEDGKPLGLMKSLQLHAGKARLTKARYTGRKKMWWTIQISVLLMCLFMVKGLKDHEALAFSFVPLFFLVAPTYYYYIMLFIPLLFFEPKLERPSGAIGIIMMFATGMAGYVFYNLAYVGRDPVKYWRQEFPTYYFMSVLLLIMVLHMMALAAVQTWRSRRKGDESSPDENVPEPGKTLGAEGMEGAKSPLPQGDG